MNHWMFRCKDVSEKVSEAMDTKLPVFQRMAISVHLMMCRYCALVQKQLLLLRKVSRQNSDEPRDKEEEVTLSKEAKDRIKRALRKMK